MPYCFIQLHTRLGTTCFGFKGTKDSTKFAQTKWIILNVESFFSFKLLLVNYAQMLNFTQILEVAPTQISWQVFQ